jgi:AcrR family transcriptional regulator
MPRPKILSDERVLDAAIALLRDGGAEALTFAALARHCGLSTATLVQRFGTKAELTRRALSRGWDQLDEMTAESARARPRTPAGAVGLLLDLSRAYDGPETYESGLLLLREDLRDPVLRARGAAWDATLTAILDDCFRSTPDAPRRIGHLLAAHWQGTLIWRAFQPSRPIGDHLMASLTEAVEALVPSLRSGQGRGDQATR